MWITVQQLQIGWTDMLGKKAILLGAVSVVAMTAGASSALAGAFALREQSAYYQGLSFAGTAAGGPSISSMFWNSATVTNTKGFTSESNHTFIVPDVRITPDPTVATAAFGDSGEMGSDAWVPSSYFGYQLNEQIYLGLAINGQFGLSTKAGPNWSGQLYARTSEVFSVNANPIVGYKFSDMLSVAVGLQVQYLDVRLTRALAATPPAPNLELAGDDIGVGFTAGVTVTPWEGTDIGLGFRSGVSHTLDGTVNVAGAVTPIKASLITPEMVTLSVKQRITDQFRALATVEWTNWSRLKAPAVIAKPTGATIATLPFNYEDGWFFALGGEYDWNERLTLRAGAAYEMSPIDESIRSLRLPDDDRIWLSAGLTYKPMENVSIDLGYTHILTANNTRVAIVPGHQDFVGLAYTGDVNSSVNIVSAGFRYTW